MFVWLVSSVSRLEPRNGEHATVDRMARRSTSPSVEQFTRTELEALRVKLEAMPRHELETFYKATHNACRYVMQLPAPRLIQELVQAWRALRRRS
jgi:hypothetical protein